MANIKPGFKQIGLKGSAKRVKTTSLTETIDEISNVINVRMTRVASLQLFVLSAQGDTIVHNVVGVEMVQVQKNSLSVAVSERKHCGQAKFTAGRPTLQNWVPQRAHQSHTT